MRQRRTAHRTRRHHRVVSVAVLGVVLGACSAHSAPSRQPVAAPVVAVSPRVSSPPAAPSAHDAALLSLPITRAGQRPPQFVVVSFDGAGGRPLWKYWRDATAAAGAHATFFLSGVYLLAPENRLDYHPPQHPPGYSDIGFGVTPNGSDPVAEISALLGNLAGAYDDGNEIGTHFNGHFCTPYRGNVAQWSTADWRAEIRQFDSLLTHVASNNGLPASAPKLPFGPSAVVGARTPCLEGNLPALHKAEVASGFRYDATDNRVGGTWPFRQDGLWNMPLSFIPVAGTHYRTLSTDYNMYANETAGADGPASLDARWRAQSLATWRAALAATYSGDRAPLSLGNHFEMWNGGAYSTALRTLMVQECRQPEVHCVSYEELANWLDREPPAALASFQAGHFRKAGPLPG